jgi:hypothetical protein
MTLSRTEVIPRPSAQALDRKFDLCFIAKMSRELLFDLLKFLESSRSHAYRVRFSLDVVVVRLG